MGLPLPRLHLRGRWQRNSRAGSRAAPFEKAAEELASLICPRSASGTFEAMQRCHAYLHPYRSKEMKTLMSMLALAVALAFTGPALLET